MPIVVTNPDGSTREISKEEFLADWEKAKTQARKKAAEETESYRAYHLWARSHRIDVGRQRSGYRQGT